jgi:hypothetical protein
MVQGLAFVGELVEAAESVDLVFAHVSYRGIDEARGFCANGGYELGLVTLRCGSPVPRRARRHNKGVVGSVAGARRRGGEGGLGGVQHSRVASEQRDRQLGLRHWYYARTLGSGDKGCMWVRGSWQAARFCGVLCAPYRHRRGTGPPGNGGGEE